MSEHPNILKSFRTLLELSSLPREDIWRLAERFDAQASRALDLFFKRTLATVIGWAVCFGISSDLIREGSLATFSVKDMSIGLIAAPLVISALYHDAIGAASLGTMFIELTRMCYSRLDFNAAGLGRSVLSASASFFDFEVLLEHADGRVATFFKKTSAIFILTVAFGPALLLGHTLYLMWLAVGVSLVAKILVSSIVGAITIRAFIAFLLMQRLLSE